MALKITDNLYGRLS